MAKKRMPRKTPEPSVEGVHVRVGWKIRRDVVDEFTDLCRARGWTIQRVAEATLMCACEAMRQNGDENGLRRIEAAMFRMSQGNASKGNGSS